jgi:7-cyano-7-deazaguanine synthase in queuosine biosynthesis
MTMIKNLINYIGTPLIGYLIMGWTGVLISFLPDLIIFPIIIKDMIYGKTNNNLVGVKRVIHQFLHTLWFPIILSVLNISIAIIWALHLVIDWFTHEKDYFFRGHEPFYPFLLPKKKEKTVLLYSGGLDSFIAAKLLKPDVLLYIKTGCRYETKELKKLKLAEKELGWKIKYVDGSFLKTFEQNNGHIPLRNLFFTQIASLYGDVVYLIGLKGELSKDKNTRFKNKTNNLLNYLFNDKMDENFKKIRIELPFKSLTKTQLIKLYLNNGFDVDDLERYTVSCYHEKYNACGKCNACFRRWVAETLNGIERKYEYNLIKYIKSEIKIYTKSDKIKYIFSNSFWINLPANLEARKVIKKW